MREEKVTNVELQNKFNSYGTLVTVASLILVVVYASGNYDGWDTLISLMGLWFGGYYLLSQVQFDWCSQYLASLIFSCSTVLFAESAIGIWGHYQVDEVIQRCEPLTCLSATDGGVSGSLVTAIIVATIITLAWGKPNA